LDRDLVEKLKVRKHDTEYGDGAEENFMMCPLCDGAPFFRTYDKETREIKETICWRCNGEAVVPKPKVWLN
jgi:hypothetical protein